MTHPVVPLCALAVQIPKQAVAVGAGVVIRPSSRQYCVTAAAGSAASMGSPAGPRRIILWFRNDLRLRDNAIVHTAVQKLHAKEFDEVKRTCW
jgi:hypothetical protein